MEMQAQLCNSQDLIDGGNYVCGNSTGLNNNINQFCLGLQQQEEQEMMVQNHNNQQSISYAIMAQAHNYNQEIDHFIRSHAKNRAMELQNFLRNMEMERQRWQKMAQDNKAMIETLSNTLEQVQEKNQFDINDNNIAEDVESCFDLKQDDEKSKKSFCKYCNFESALVLFLPCRHLCCCKVCEIALESCPICGVEKKASIEALIC
ncbi:hypothetical protein ACFE04_014475 [Oxalis oulophora]